MYKKKQKQLNYAMIICQVIANNQIQDNVRMSAGLALKNSLAKSRTFGGILADQRSKHVIKSNVKSTEIITKLFYINATL
jgi:hypothetical protein